MRSRTGWRDIHGVTKGCLLTSAALAILTAPFYHLTGLRIDWASGVHIFAATGGAGLLWFYHLRYPGRPDEWPVTEVLGAIFLIALFTNVLTPAQYVAVALDRPLIDPALARVDGWLGIDVAALAAWTWAHPTAHTILSVAYGSLLAQFGGTPIIVALWYRDRDRLWEYVFHFHFCGVLTVLSLALFPAACAFLYLGFESALPQARFIAHFSGLRDGSLTTIDLSNLEGLISMPSFHVAGALMATWAVRGRRSILVAFSILNATLIASTVLTGAHYAVDIAASVALFAVSVGCYRRLIVPTLGQHLARMETSAG